MVLRSFQCLLTLALAVVAVSAAGPPDWNSRLLVLTEDASTASTHSRLLKSLRDKGYTIDVRDVSTASSEEVALNAKGESKSTYRYGGVVLLCPTSTALPKKLPLMSLERFIDRGGNVFFSSSGGYSSYVFSLAKAIGVDLDDGATRVVDHVNYHAELDGGQHTYVKAGGIADSAYVFGAVPAPSSIVFHGPGASLNDDNELIEPLLWGSGASFSYTPGERVSANPHEAGSATILAAALPTRSGGRVVYFGSYDALSDTTADIAGSAHADAMGALAGWTFGYTGVLRAVNLRHRTAREGGSSNGYRVKDEILFAIDIQAWDGARGVWGQYAADDVQLELVMLNPWVRMRLQSVGNGDVSSYTALVPVPDQIGIYKFYISYHRVGVSPVEVTEVVPIRPFLHYEFRRFIPMAYPYYAACFVMMASVFMLGIALNFGKLSMSSLGDVATSPVKKSALDERSSGQRPASRLRKRNKDDVTAS